MTQDRRRFTPSIPLIPYGDPAEWKEANQSIAQLCRRYGRQLQPAADQARELKEIYSVLAGRMDELGRQTCTLCPDPCCLHATIGYDLPDLIYLHLTGRRIPPYQTMMGKNDICRFSSARGCRLPRLSRPFICTWYRCPTQQSAVKKQTTTAGQQVETLIQQAKTLRRSMEQIFIRITS